jgi:hypothetical protein
MKQMGGAHHAPAFSTHRPRSERRTAPGSGYDAKIQPGIKLFPERGCGFIGTCTAAAGTAVVAPARVMCGAMALGLEFAVPLVSAVTGSAAR